MFSTILVPLNGSPHAEAALPVAVEEASRHNARLVLLHVIVRPEQPPFPGGPRSGPFCHPAPCNPGKLVEDEAHAVAYLTDIRQRAGLPSDTAVRLAVGDPAHQIRAELARWPAPLLVLTTGNCTTQPTPPLSEVARRLLLGPVPVLAVRPDVLRLPSAELRPWAQMMASA